MTGTGWLHRGLATLLVVVLAAALLQVMADPGATDPAGCERDRDDAAVRAHPAGGPGDHHGSGPRTVVIGDSWSVGLGLPDLHDSWPAYLPGRVHVAGFSGSGFSPEARVCARSAFHQRAAGAVRDGADLVVVQGGLNDHDQAAARTRVGFGRLMARLDGHPVVVVGPAPAPARAEDAHRVDALLARLADRRGVPYVSTIGWDLPYLEDGLHLTPAGHRQFGGRVAEAVAGAGHPG